MVRILGLLFKHRTIIRIRFHFNPRCGTWGLLQTVHSSVVLTAEDGFFCSFVLPVCDFWDSRDFSLDI